MKKIAVVIASLALSACALQPKRVFYQRNAVGGLDWKSLDLYLFEHQLPPDQNISNTTIREYETSSVHLVQIRGAEKPHRHQYHDSVVFIEAGQGTLYLGKNAVKVKTGSVIFIEHNTPHYFVNEGAEPAVALVVFSPP